MTTKRLSEQERADRLTNELEMWRLRGYQVTARSSTTANLTKPKGGALGWVLILLVLSLMTIPFTSIGVAGIVFLLGLVLITAWQSGRRDQHAQLTVDPDGTIYHE